MDTSILTTLLSRPYIQCCSQVGSFFGIGLFLIQEQNRKDDDDNYVVDGSISHVVNGSIVGKSARKGRSEIVIGVSMTRSVRWVGLWWAADAVRQRVMARDSRRERDSRV